MPLNSGLIFLILTFTVVLISARNLRFDFIDQLDDDIFPDEPIHIVPSINRNFHQAPSLSKRIFNLMANDPYEQDRTLAVGRRTKAIIKGDPREFMG